MKTEPQDSADRTLLCFFLKEMSLAMLTYLDDEGSLVSKPVAPLLMDGRGALWFFVDIRICKPEYTNVVNLGFTDPALGHYVSVSGCGEIDLSQRRLQQLWTSTAAPWFPDGPKSGYLGVLKFIPEMAAYWDANSSRMIRMSALTDEVNADYPSPLGEREGTAEKSAAA